MRRYLDTFLRHPWLYLAPAALVLAIALSLALQALRAEPRYTSTATVAVNLDPSRPRPVGDRPPAEHYSELLGELIETDSFILAALRATSLGQTLDNGAADPALAKEVRDGWRQFTAGPNTFRVSYRCADPAYCAEVIAAVLAQFREDTTTAALAGRRIAVDFYERQVRAAEERLRALPATDPAREPARETYETLLTRLSDVRLEETLDQQARQNEFRILTPPQAAETADRPLGEALLPLILGGLMALLLTVAVIVLATWLDTTIRSPEDVYERLGVTTIAVVPHGYRPRSQTANGAHQSRAGSRRLGLAPAGLRRRLLGRRTHPATVKEKIRG